MTKDAPETKDKPFPVVRSGLAPSAPLGWLRLGWDDFRASGSASLFYGACFAVAGILLVLALRHATHLVAAVTTGFMLLGPFLGMGLYELSRRRERGEPLVLSASLTVWRRNLPAIGLFSLIVIVLYLIWARASVVTFALFYQGGLPTLEGLLAELARFENVEFMIAYLLVGGFFAGLVFSFSVVAIPLMLDRDQDTVTAMLASFIAVVRNVPAMLVWGLLIVVLTVLGFATAFIGLLVTMPLAGHATWHAYRALIEPARD
jgi:uncharacterized membrane protein